MKLNRQHIKNYISEEVKKAFSERGTVNVIIERALTAMVDVMCDEIENKSEIPEFTPKKKVV